MVRRGSLLALLLLAVGAVLVPAGTSAARRSHLIAADRHAAIVQGQRLLGDVVLPPGSTSAADEPGGDGHRLARNVFPPLFAAEVDRHAFWTASASVETVIASLESHLPAGAKLVTAFSGGGTGPSSPQTFAGAAYAFGSTGKYNIGPQLVVVQAVLLSGGLTGIRADAEVRYFSPRPPRERVPGAARLLEITKREPGGRPSLSLLVTRLSQVRGLEQVVDGLPFANTHSGAAYSCPLSLSPSVTFAFRATSGGPALAKVTELADTPRWADACEEATLAIRGHALAPLLDGGILISRASQLLGVRLAKDVNSRPTVGRRFTEFASPILMPMKFLLTGITSIDKYK